MKLEDVQNDLINLTETELKGVMGDLWDKYKDEAQDWLKLLAQLQLAIAQNKTPETTECTRKHAQAGMRCFLRRVRGDAEEAVGNFVQAFFDMLLNRAVALGKDALNKFGDKAEEVIDKLEDKLDGRD